jgi:hypothetical protein
MFRTSQAEQRLLFQGRCAKMKMVCAQEDKRQQGNDEEIKNQSVSQL